MQGTRENQRDPLQQILKQFSTLTIYFQSFLTYFILIILAILLILSITVWQSIASTVYLLYSQNMIQEYKRAHSEISTIGTTIGKLYTTYFRILLSYQDASKENYTLAITSFDEVRNCLSNWELLHNSKNTRQFKEYNRQYYEITSSDFCPYMALTGHVYYQETLDSCNSSAAGIGGIGLFPVITFILDSMREYLEKLGFSFEQYTNSTELELTLSTILNEYALQDIHDYTNKFARPIYYYLNKQILSIMENNEEYWKKWANNSFYLEIFTMLLLIIFISFAINGEYIQYKKYLESISVIPVQIRVRSKILMDYVKSILSTI